MLVCFRNISLTCGNLFLNFWLITANNMSLLITSVPHSLILYFLFLSEGLHFREVLASSTSDFHLVRSLMQSFQFVIFILVMSLFISSSHLFLCLSSNLVNAVDHTYTFFTMLLSGVRCTCPNQANLCALI